MKINFRDQEFDLHYGMRIYIIYENIMGKGLGFEELQSYTSVISLFYAAVVSSLQYNKLDSNVSYDEFIDWLDEDSAVKIKDFTQWFMSNVTAQSDKIDEAYEKELKETKSSKSSKSKN